MRRPKRGVIWAGELWGRQLRRRWRTRRERRAEDAARRTRDRRIRRRSVWRHRWPMTRVLSCAGATILVAWLVYSLGIAIGLWSEITPRPMSDWCSGSGRGYYCAEVKDFAKTLLVTALAITGFLLWRYRKIRGWYRRRGFGDRQMVIPTAERDITDVVGREELCDLLVQRLRDREHRRPLLLVGGIGSGKTATLVRLAEKLMADGVVPVGIELRSVSRASELDFHQLARAQFQNAVDSALHAEGDADRAWRQLWGENRIVVLADGLEEALADTDHPCDRDSVLREAVREAVREGLPIVIASRPDDPLRGLEALLLQLEPLAISAGLEYVQAQSQRLDPAQRWDRITDLIKAADVAESPFYLRIIGQLHQIHWIDHVGPAGEDRPSVRWQLLKQWHRAVVDGELYEDYGLPPAERHDALEVLSALACIGLRNNRMTVRTSDLTGADPGRQWIIAELKARLRKLDADNPQDVGLAETTGDALNIVVKRHEGVRFQHGDVQAYLGARFLTAALRDETFLDDAVGKNDGPSRELLAALTLYSRSEGAFERMDGGERQHPQRDWNWVADHVRWLVEPRSGAHEQKFTRDRTIVLVNRLLRAAVETRNRTRALEMFAAALEMDAAAGHVVHRRLAAAVRDAWGRYQGDGSITDRPLEDAKIALIHRFGGAARMVGRHSSMSVPRRWRKPTPQYRKLFEMMGDETSYLARLHGARELSQGGNATVRALRPVLGEAPGGGGGRADPRGDRLRQVQTWMAPALFLFSDPRHEPGEPDWHDLARDNLRRWVDRLAQSPSDEARVWEISLAQGFRLAVNCRHFPNHRAVLREETERALRHSRFWYSHLVLVQALTLLALPRHPAERLRKLGHGSDPRGLVDRWLAIAGGGNDAPLTGSGSSHPLVREVADLCVEALVDRHPERHCWADEREVVGRVGSSSPDPSIRNLEDSWLPPSHGWGVLRPRAQRLLADVMLLLNLAARGGDDAERARRLTRASRDELPPCLTIDRTAMRVELSRGQANDVQPGSTCIDDCTFRLCPLPPKGDELPYQMDEMFCARQIDLVGHWYRVSEWADWQAVNQQELREFWRQMSERMRPAWRK